MPKLYDIENIRKTGIYPDVDRSILAQIPLPPAGDRTKWFGVQHEELVKTLQDEIIKAGMNIDGETWTLSGKGERLHGYIEVSLDEANFEDTKKTLDLPDEIEYDGFALDDIDLRMGLRHSNDSSVALYLMVVPRMKDGGNGMTVGGGNISLHRRHTQAIGDTPDGLEKACKEGVKTFLLKAATIQQEINTLRAIPLTDHDAHHVMVVAASKKIIPWSTIAKVEKEWEGGNSAWDLYLAMTKPGMTYHIFREMGLINQSRKLILELCVEAEDQIAAEGMNDNPATEHIRRVTLFDGTEIIMDDPVTGGGSGSRGNCDQLLETGHFSPTEEVKEEGEEAEEVPAEQVEEETELNTRPAPQNRLPQTAEEMDLADIF